MANELRRRRMMEDMQYHRQEDDIADEQLKAHQSFLLNDLCRKLVTSLTILFFLGVFAILHFRPKIFFKERLPRRTLITVYPDRLQIRKKLPSVVMGYALVDPTNREEREAVQKVAAMRNLLSDPGRSVRQTIVLNPWEHADFRRQMMERQPGALDFYCGQGYQELYQRYQADDLLLMCLLKLGTADGYVKFHVNVTAPIVRGVQGVAVQYLNQPRIHSDLLLLPIRDSTVDAPIATVLSQEMTKFVLATDYQYSQKQYEEFLYKVISKENSWVMFHAACHPEDQQVLETTQRLVAISCVSDDECCKVYDPQQRPFVSRVRRDEGMD